MKVTEQAFQRLWCKRLETECSKALFTYWKEEYSGTLFIMETYNSFATLDVVHKLEFVYGLPNGPAQGHATLLKEDGSFGEKPVTVRLCNRKWCFVRRV